MKYMIERVTLNNGMRRYYVYVKKWFGWVSIIKDKDGYISYCGDEKFAHTYINDHWGNRAKSKEVKYVFYKEQDGGFTTRTVLKEK